jgi:hypothetical protein
MQTFILLAIAASVVSGIIIFCVDFYRNRNRAVDPSTFNEFTAIDVASVAPLDPVSLSEAAPVVEGLGHWAEAAAAILNSGGWRLKSRLHKQNLPSQVEELVKNPADLTILSLEFSPRRWTLFV